MPTIISLAAGSARGFGHARKMANDGTKAIFAIGNSTTTRNKYTYSDCSSTASGVGGASANSYGGSAAGNGSRGIFSIGYTACGASTTRNKYTYSDCSSTATGVAAATSGTYGSSAVGNSTRGIFSINPGGARNKYTYSNCTSTQPSGCMGASSYTAWGAAAGNCSKGIFALGFDYNHLPQAGNSKLRDKYTYATCVSTATTASLKASGYGSAAGNSTRGIFALGTTCCAIVSGIREKFTYSNCTTTSCGVASVSSATYASDGSAAGNSTRGIFQLGQACSVRTTKRNKYTYASCTSTASGVASASANVVYGSGVSWALGVNCLS